MIVIAKKTEKQILVICIIEQHKDSNDRSGKKFAIVFTHLIMHMHEPEKTNGGEEFQVSSWQNRG